MTFADDERGQPVVIGALLIFTILILAFAGYQAFVVPNQNAEVEFNHFQDVQSDFSELRSTTINSVGSNEERSASLTLGTQYPARLFALNPSPVSGQLSTTPPRQVTVDGDSGIVTGEICGSTDATSRSLVYTPNYNEFRSPQAVSFENTFVSREFRDANRYGDQRLVQQRSDGPDRIDLLLLNGSISRGGQTAFSLDIRGSSRRSTTVENPIITVPSRFSATEWENEILDGVNNIDGISSPETGLIRIEFSGTYRVSCAVAGLNGEPAFGPEGDADGGNDINPAAPGDIRLNGPKTVNTGSNEVEVAFQNLNSEDTNITDARINFYQSNTGDSPQEAVIAADQGGDSGTLPIGSSFKSVSPQITLTGSSESTVWLNFDKGVQKNDWFVLTLQFDNGEVGQYFISLRDDATGDGGGDNGNPATIQNGIEYTGGLTTTDSISALQFNIENVDSQKARLNAVRVTNNINNAGEIWRTDGANQGPEIEVTGGESNGQAEAGNPDSFKPKDAAFQADGSQIQMDSNGVLDTSGGGTSATFFVGNFGKAPGNNFNQYDFGTVSRVSETSDWDVKVSLEFQNRGAVNYYFKET